MTEKIDPFVAAQLLEDEAFKRGASILRDRYKEQWALSQRIEDREKLYQKVLLLDEVINEFRSAIRAK